MMASVDTRHHEGLAVRYVVCLLLLLLLPAIASAEGIPLQLTEILFCQRCLLLDTRQIEDIKAELLRNPPAEQVRMYQIQLKVLADNCRSLKEELLRRGVKSQ
jgi:hypothetical protein